MNNIDWRKVGIAVGVLAALVLFIIAILYFTSKRGAAPTTGGTFGNIPTAPQAPATAGGAAAGVIPTFTTGGAAPAQRVFKIADGPIVAAVLVTTGRPTTTIARYLTGEDGHVLELPLDVAGAVPHIVSNVTIPGIERALWTDGGNGLVVQYIDSGSLASAHLALPLATTSATSSAATPIAINFLPKNIVDIASAPNGAQIAYLLPNAIGGADGYVSNTNGSNAKKLFSLPLSQLVLTWPTANTLLAYTKSASGIEGIAFSITVKTGTVTPILYGLGLTATADPAFKTILYRTDNGTNASLFAEQISTGHTSSTLWPSPLSAALPDTCTWGVVATTSVAFCAAPAGAIPQNYLDLWYRGQSSVADSIVAIAPTVSATAVPLATPGTSDGGENSDAIDLSVSPDLKYLSFISKDDAVLWGVRLQ